MVGWFHVLARRLSRQPSQHDLDDYVYLSAAGSRGASHTRMSMADLSQYNEMEVAAIMSTAKKVATLPLLIDFGIQQTVKDSNAGKDTTDPLLVLLAAEVRRVVQHEICGAEPSPARASITFVPPPQRDRLSPWDARSAVSTTEVASDDALTTPAGYTMLLRARAAGGGACPRGVGASVKRHRTRACDVERGEHTLRVVPQSAEPGARRGAQG